MDTHPNDLWVKAEIAHVRSGLARILGAHGHARGGRGSVSISWLGRLPDGWHLVSDIPVEERGASIGLLVGPPGVFAIDTRNVTGNVWVGASGVRVNGHATDFVRNAVVEAKRAARVLSDELQRPVEVRPVLAILADAWTVQQPRDDVIIGAPRGVKDWLRRLPPILDVGDVRQIAAAAAEPFTWDPF